MTLENVFYTMGIIFMLLGTLLLIGVIVLLFYIKKKISETYVILNETMSKVKYAASHPEDLAFSIGTGIARTAVEKVKSMAKSRSNS